MATESEVKFLGTEGTEQLVATVKEQLADKVSVSEQTLTTEQKSQIRKNIGAAEETLIFTESYNDGDIVTLKNDQGLVLNSLVLNGITRPADSKNLCSLSHAEVVGSEHVGCIEFDIEEIPAGTYAMSAKIESTSDAEGQLVHFVDADGNTVKDLLLTMQDEAIDGRKCRTYINVPNAFCKLRLYAANNWNASINNTTRYTDIQIESGNLPTAYEPYYKAGDGVHAELSFGDVKFSADAELFEGDSLDFATRTICRNDGTTSDIACIGDIISLNGTYELSSNGTVTITVSQEQPHISYAPQLLTKKQKDQARENIGACDTEYVDLKLSNKITAAMPQLYGAKGDGVTDDTAAFQQALASNREVYVPGGTYLLSGELTIEGNCKLSLSQDTVFNFTQTEGNCISLKKLSYLEGNHATINVPYYFNGNVLSTTTLEDGGGRQPEPFTQHWSPMWKTGRYVTNINIIKVDSYGLNYSDDGVCYGTALYIHTAAAGDTTTSFMWGNTFTGLRISGGFSYGVRMVTEKTDSTWNNNTTIEGFVEHCEIGCYIENTNNAVVSLIIQPRAAHDGTLYAKHGIKLVNSNQNDLQNTRVWDWTDEHTLKTGTADECEYQPYAMYGDCKGTFIHTHNDSVWSWENTIYSDNITNLLCTTLISGRGIVQIHPKYAFYKNPTTSNYAYNSGRVAWRDGVNINRYDIPVTVQNPYIHPNRVYKIGSFNFNDADDFPDDRLTEQTLTIEEVNRRGLTGWSNIFFDVEKAIVQYYWKPIGKSNKDRVPVYYYSLNGNTYTVYKLIRDYEDMQYVRNCKVSISNSRRFILDFEDVGDMADIDTSSIIRIDPIYNENDNCNPKLQGMYGYTSGVPVVCTNSAVFDGNGNEIEPSTVKQLVCLDDVVKEVSPDDEKPVTSKAVYDFVSEVGVGGSGSGVTTEDKYELIESITADGSIISRTQEPDGSPYKFKAVLLNLITPAGTTLSGFNMRVIVGGETIQSWVDAINEAQSGEYNAPMWYERKGGLWWWYSKKRFLSNSTNTIIGNVGHFTGTTITQVVTSAAVTAGNILEIWAIRA